MVPETMTWCSGELSILDQRRLPWDVSRILCRSCQDVAEAIRSMAVRGAPAIGVAAAYGMALAAMAGEDLFHARDRLMATRPTAVNLRWALDRMDALARSGVSPDRMLQEAVAIHEEDRRVNRSIGAHGESLISDGATVITHCNAGAIATAGWGTALGIFRSCAKAGKNITIYADETRPRFQGGLTAWELMEDGFDVTVITDGMAAWLMRTREIHAVIVGADRIAANGDAANKIGTYGLSLVAKAHGVPFYVAAPLSTMDLSLPSGEAIPIEERSGEEIRRPWGHSMLPSSVSVWNPGFDVTPAGNITAIVTEAGVLHPPYEDSIATCITGSV